MVAFYLDASVIVPLVSKETITPLVDKFVEALDEKPFVSAMAVGEVCSATSRLVRMGVISLEVARERLANFDQWIALNAQAIETEASDIRLATSFVRRMTLNLRLPDAIHLAAAARQGLTLATLDRRLADAARSLDLRVVVPE